MYNILIMKLTVQEAYDKINNFSILNIEHEHIDNKGAMGHVLEKLLGLKLGSDRLDLRDGELKTFHYNERNAVKEDFRITSVWNLDEIKEKLDCLLVVGASCPNNQIVFVKIVKPLENPFFLKQLEIEVPFIMEKGPMNCSQKDTNVFIAKTQGKGGDAPKTRSLYISRPWAHALLHGVYPAGARKGKHLVPEFELSFKKIN